MQVNVIDNIIKHWFLPYCWDIHRTVWQLYNFGIKTSNCSKDIQDENKIKTKLRKTSQIYRIYVVVNIEIKPCGMIVNKKKRHLHKRPHDVDVYNYRSPNCLQQ